MESDISVQNTGREAGEQHDFAQLLGDHLRSQHHGDHLNDLETSGSGSISDYYEDSGEPYKGESDYSSFLLSPTESHKSKTMGMGDIYQGEDANTRMTHLMHSDTMIVVIALIAMIVLGLIFRSLCMRLTSKNVRKERVRVGLRAMAEHMNTVTRSMSNDLEPPDSPQAVMRTYSNYGRVRPTLKDTMEDTAIKPAPVRHQSRENLRVMALNDTMKDTAIKPAPVRHQSRENLRVMALKDNMEDTAIKPALVRHQSRENLRVMAFNNLLSGKEGVIAIEMEQVIPGEQQRNR